MLRLMGGVAIYLRCPSARAHPRSYRDLDFVVPSSHGRQVEALFADTGYAADATFNKLNGAQRMLFWDPTHARRVDVIVDQLEMCHTLDLRQRLACHNRTLSLADLLLSKLQIVHISERDLLDAATLLQDHALTQDESGINAHYLADLCAHDWGLYRTCQINLDRICAFEPAHLPAGVYGHIPQAETLLKALAAAPKTLRWKLRSRVGERVRWYNLPEEIGG